MLPRKLNLTLLMFSWALISCSTPPNITACANLGDSAHCVEYMTHKKYNVDATHPYINSRGQKMTLKQLVDGSALLPSDQAAALKTYFDNICHQQTCPNNVGDWSSFANELGIK